MQLMALGLASSNAAWSCPPGPCLSTVGSEAEGETMIRRFSSNVIHDLKHDVDIGVPIVLSFIGCFIRLLSCSLINLSHLYIVKSHLLAVTQTAALTALLA